MLSVKQRAKYYLVFISTTILICSVVYDYSMRTFEPGTYPPEEVSFSLLYSMQFVVETFTATGYGSHSPWFSPEMQTLVMIIDLTGVAVFFIALPAVFIPVFRNLLSTTVPDGVEEDFTDHVIICTYTPRAESLIKELEASEVGYVLVEPNRETAVELLEEGREVVHADPKLVSDLRDANVTEARALVADISDQVDASIVLAAREATEDIEIISVVEDPDFAGYHRLAGADAVLRPRELLGKSLAAKVTTAVSADVDGIEVGDDFEIAEVPIGQTSSLVGTTLAESRLRERYGVNVIGAWFRGDFRTPPDPDKELGRGTVLLVSGTEESLDEMREKVLSPLRSSHRGEVIVIGCGKGGAVVANRLEDADVPHTVVDRHQKDAVDVIGDATDTETLREAGVETAKSVVLALSDDTTTEFTTLVTRDLNDSTEIVARAQTNEAVGKTYRAGADYVLSIERVSGRSIASEVLDEEILSVSTKIDVVKTEAPGLVGETLEGARVRDRTGCTVVAVEREAETVTELDPGFDLKEGDRVVVAGTDDGTNRFLEEFG